MLAKVLGSGPKEEAQGDREVTCFAEWISKQRILQGQHWPYCAQKTNLQRTIPHDEDGMLTASCSLEHIRVQYLHRAYSRFQSSVAELALAVVAHRVSSPVLGH